MKSVNRPKKIRKYVVIARDARSRIIGTVLAHIGNNRPHGVGQGGIR